MLGIISARLWTRAFKPFLISVAVMAAPTSYPAVALNRYYVDAGSGMSSGGALLSENSGHMMLAAIYRSTWESKTQEAKELETGVPANADYSALNWNSGAVAVRGNFLKKIIEVTGGG